MTFRIFRRDRLQIMATGVVVLISFLVACGGEEVTVTISATATPQPTFTSTPTPTITPILTPSLAPTPLPGAAGLMLEVSSPRDNTVVRSDTVTVEGLTSPDATVSVNGRLAIPAPDGRFSTDLSIAEEGNPLLIEVIATSISGERRDIVLTVIYIS